MTLLGANPRLRLYRYGPGERHGAHWDTIVELPKGVRSLVTLVFYLNEGFDGGQTDFVELGKCIVLRMGRALLFQHRILHEATEVTRGAEFVLRTDPISTVLAEGPRSEPWSLRPRRSGTATLCDFWPAAPKRSLGGTSTASSSAATDSGGPRSCGTLSCFSTT